MLHKGNISSIHICPEDVTDCVIGGSPCQDLSVAGLRKGIKHSSKGDEETTRSGLFMEQIRIIKEMRDVDKRAGRTGVDIRPRWAVWENVPGAVSSGKPKGEDFRIVLEEFAKIADTAVTIPGPPRGGWQPAGCIVGDGFSVAWRIMDARYHGVPQRRRRIALVCDFAADSAPSVLFDEEGMRWDFETSQRAWKGIAPYFAGCAAGSDRPGLGSDRGVEQSKGPGADLYNACLTGEIATTLRAQMHGHPPVVCGEANARLFEPASMKEENWQERDQKNALRSRESKVGRVVVESAAPDVVYPIEGNGQRASHQGDGWSEEQVGYTLNSVERHGVAYAVAETKESLVSGVIPVNEQIASRWKFPGERTGLGVGNEGDPAFTLQAAHPHFVAYAVDGNVCDRVSAKNGCGYSENVSPTLNTQDRHAVAYDTTQITSPQNWSNPKPGDPCHPFAAHQHAPLAVYDARGNGDGETVQTLTGDHARTVSDYTPLVCSIDGRNCTMNEEISGTLQGKPTGGQSLNCVNPVCIEQTKCVYWDGGQVANTLTKKGMDQRMPDKGQFQRVLQPEHRKYIVRRLTPLECSRLQGMPDDWCDVPAQSNVTQEDLEHWRPILDEWAKINDKKPKSDAQIVKWLSSPVSESAQYQMYGNGIALPQWVWVCGRIIETYGEHKPTMASLFDGTGSFPLIWNSILGGAYTAWSSEVNPDAIRVSKYRMEERGW